MFFKRESFIIPLCNNYTMQGHLLLKMKEELTQTTHKYLEKKFDIKLSSVQKRDHDGNLKIAFDKNIDFSEEHEQYQSSEDPPSIVINTGYEVGKLKATEGFTQDVEYGCTLFYSTIRKKRRLAEFFDDDIQPVCTIS